MISNTFSTAKLEMLGLDTCLGADELQLLGRHLECIEYPANRKVVVMGHEDRDLYLVTSGRLKVCRVSSTGKETILGYLAPGQWFGELAFLLGKPRTADVVCVEPSMCGRLSHEVYHREAPRFPGLSQLLAQAVGEKLAEASRRLSLLAFGGIDEKLEYALRSLAEPHPLHPNKLLRVCPRPTHQVLAGLVGATREAVTRAVHILEERGVLLIEPDAMYLRSGS